MFVLWGQESKGVSATMLDAVTQQLALSQQLAALQQSRIERVLSF